MDLCAFLVRETTNVRFPREVWDECYLNAIEALLDVLDEHAGQGWADEQAQSGFGKKAAGTVKELNEAIVANKALSEAREVGAEAPLGAGGTGTPT